MNMDVSRAARHTQRRQGHLEAFLTSRALTVEELAAEARARTGAGEVYFVSTAVHGLAGSTSDIDLIVVSPARLQDASRISTMAFAQGSRLGIKHYGHEEVVQSMAYLADLSDRTAGEVWQGVTSWRAPAPLVDIERLINGLRDDGVSPHAHGLEHLCGVRFSYSFGLFREAIIHGCLAQRASETRAPWGYLLHALPHLMDVVLSCEGDVVTNIKWTTQRWGQSDAARTEEWRLIDDWWSRAWNGLRAKGAPPKPDDFLTLYEQAKSALGLSLGEDREPLSWRDDLQTAPFGEGVELTRDGAGRIVLHEVADLRRDYALEELCRLEQSTARGVLAFVRANFAHARLRQSQLAGHGKALFRGHAR